MRYWLFSTVFGGIIFFRCGSKRVKRNLSKSAFSEGVGHFELKFYIDGDIA